VFIIFQTAVQSLFPPPRVRARRDSFFDLAQGACRRQIRFTPMGVFGFVG